ncbi:hypothetical protein A2774_04105 [Candidatus Roizmanbacteria bacterium RIFCSPHIGHO2_01_FULL_39_12c]|uniref:Polysaccharide biosynthesis protein C-terminal domain-containing protein n=1 Tax=Candidatus Roizmanbacteria bacterium RIFCSPHIGHO2_01_FULL_39_12c TaxID=1802031 RepID=A0A1F7GEQ1_9BACT|nr:MAG: hypothetical protein A2774_04105 [Candidatus Roizmanbacteria bacterium RIFCSPHIGHO2_01_FULL_39_12c]OGK48079.1 MAG: hypothetical protein A2963_03920 [Candidatus Roizmanbacteria bacterium RIFCSPLOWO2_01_FULL_40_13]
MKNYKSKLKVGFIVVLYKTPLTEINRIENEIIKLGFTDFQIYFIDNSKENKGYAGGANSAIEQAKIDNCELLIVINPDISFKKLKSKDLLAGGKHFDIWGLAMRQRGKIYYGGSLDPWRLTGGLIDERPSKRFVKTDWISGSLLIIKKKVTDKVGLFDEEYFMYYEDVDFCLRARKSGFRTGVDSGKVYDHFEWFSSNPEKEKLLNTARWKFFRKYANFRQRAYELLRSPKHLLEKQRFWTPRFLKSYEGRASRNDKKYKFILNFGSLNISSLINKTLNFILFVFLIRYLSPEDYGTYTLVWTQAAIFSPFVDLGTTSYGLIDLPTEKKQKFLTMHNLRLFVSLIAFVLTIASGLALFKDNPKIINYLALTSFIIFSNMWSGSYLILNALRGKLYNSAMVSILFNLVLICSLIVLMIFFRSLAVIFLAVFLFYSLYSLINYLLIRKDFTPLKFKLDFAAWKKLLRKSYLYVLIGFFAGIYFRLDLYLLKILKSEAEVGIYSSGFKFFEALMFVAASYNITRIPIFARIIKNSRSKFLELVGKDLIALLTVGITILLSVYFLSPVFLPFVLKGGYLTAIRVLKIVIFAFPLILVSSVLINSLYVMQKAYLVLVIFMLQTGINFLLNLYFIPKFSYIASAYITVVSEMVNLILLGSVFLNSWKKSNL